MINGYHTTTLPPSQYLVFIPNRNVTHPQTHMASSPRSVPARGPRSRIVQQGHRPRGAHHHTEPRGMWLAVGVRVRHTTRMAPRPATLRRYTCATVVVLAPPRSMHLRSFHPSRPVLPTVACFCCARPLLASMATTMRVRAGAAPVPVCVRCRRCPVFTQLPVVAAPSLP